MKSILYFYTLLTLFFVGIPVSTYAFGLHVSPDIVITEENKSTENLYLVGLNTNFNSIHDQDLVSVGWNQILKGSIFGDTLLFGDTISLEGEYFDDVRIVANTAHVKGVTNKDLIIIARTIILEPDTIINGESLFLANTIVVKGQILGETQITANTIEISGSVMSPITLTGQKIFINSSAKISSDVSYFSPQRATVDSSAVIEKELNFNQIESVSQNEVLKRIFFAFISFWSIIKLIATLFIIFILTQLFRVFSQRVVDIIDRQKFYSILIGFVCTIGIPVLIIILFGSLVLIPVAFILAFVFGIIVILVPAISAISIAFIYQKYIKKITKPTIEFNISALAFIALTFINFIPIFGPLIKYVLFFVSISAVCTYVYEQVRGIKKI